MMGRLKSDQGQLFYEFHLSDAVPEDHLVRKIDAALYLSWLRSELAPHYSSTGRPSVDPELMIRMLIVGYVFGGRAAGQQGAQFRTRATQQRRLYSITSSARACSIGGTVMPNAFAALRLMTNSNLVGCITGKSAGLAP